MRAEFGSVTGDTGEECGWQHYDAHPRPLELAGEVSLSQIKGRKGDAASAEAHQTCPEQWWMKDKIRRNELHMYGLYGVPGYTLCILVFEKWWEFETWQENSHVPFNNLISTNTFFFHFLINILSVYNYFSNAIHLSILWNIARQWNTCMSFTLHLLALIA